MLINVLIGESLAGSILLSFAPRRSFAELLAATLALAPLMMAGALVIIP